MSLFLLTACGKPKTDPKTGETACRTREEMRSLCYVEEMVKLNHDFAMDAWVKNYCASIYVNQSCYTQSYH